MFILQEFFLAALCCSTLVLSDTVDDEYDKKIDKYSKENPDSQNVYNDKIIFSPEQLEYLLSLSKSGKLELFLSKANDRINKVDITSNQNEHASTRTNKDVCLSSLDLYKFSSSLNDDEQSRMSQILLERLKQLHIEERRKIYEHIDIIHKKEFDEYEFGLTHDNFAKYTCLLDKRLHEFKDRVSFQVDTLAKDIKGKNKIGSSINQTIGSNNKSAKIMQTKLTKPAIAQNPTFSRQQPTTSKFSLTAGKLKSPTALIQTKAKETSTSAISKAPSLPTIPKPQAPTTTSRFPSTVRSRKVLRSDENLPQSISENQTSSPSKLHESIQTGNILIPLTPIIVNKSIADSIESTVKVNDRYKSKSSSRKAKEICRLCRKDLEDEYGTGLTTTRCGHKFHDSCLKTSMDEQVNIDTS